MANANIKRVTWFEGRKKSWYVIEYQSGRTFSRETITNKNVTKFIESATNRTDGFDDVLKCKTITWEG